MTNSQSQYNLSKTLGRRQQMSTNLGNAIQEAPTEMEKLLTVIGEVYYSGNVPRFWDVLAHLAGAERGCVPCSGIV